MESQANTKAHGLEIMDANLRFKEREREVSYRQGGARHSMHLMQLVLTFQLMWLGYKVDPL